MPRRLRSLVFSGTATGLALLAIASYFGKTYWVFDLIGHFRPQLGFTAILLGVAAWCDRRPRCSMIFIAAWAILLAPVAAVWVKTKTVHVQSLLPAKNLNDSVISIAFLNLHIDNKDPNAAIRALISNSPDVLALVEASPAAYAALKAETHYPYLYPSSAEGETIIASKLPLDNPHLYHFGKDPNPLDKFVTITGIPLGQGEILRLVVLHVDSPKSAFHTTIRNEHLARLGRYLGNINSRILVVGDHNITPWHPVYRQMLADAGLVSWHPTPFWPGTWNNHLPAISRVPIDLIATSPNVTVQTLRPLNVLHGSDHAALWIEISRGH
ncbi:MAG: endonuclease/exonuclease/phosphatase family protein [Holosporales bacterium]